jgi:RNA polymerase sigma-70 factor (ECF subfamily)
MIKTWRYSGPAQAESSMQPNGIRHLPPKPTADQVTQWAAKARQGDRRAFERLARHFWDEVYRMLYYRVSHPADAEDLCQEVFIKAFTRMPKLRQPESVRAWLYGIALNQSRDFLRKRRLLSIFQSTPQGDHPEQEDRGPAGASALDTASAKRFWQKVSRFNQSLPRLQREVFTLRYLDELTIPEIAQALGRSQSTVKTHLYRAVERFKKSHSLVRELREEIS